MNPAPIATTPLAPEVPLSLLTTRDVFPDAAFDVPLDLPTEWTQPSRSRVVRLISQTFSPLPQPGEEQSTPLNAPPAPGFWSVYARQRGLVNGDPFWVRELPAAPLHARAAIEFTAVLEGLIGDLDAQLAACTTQRARSTVGANLVFGARVAASVPDGEFHARSEGQIGWRVKNGMFAAWLDVVPVTVRDIAREDQVSRGRRKRLVPLVDERLVDWFCMSAAALAAGAAPVRSRQVFDRQIA